MVLEEIVAAALARCAELGGSYPTARSVLYRRVAVRTAQLLALAAEWNPDLAAVAVALPIDLDPASGAPVVDLTALPTPPLALLGVTIADPGVSGYAEGQVVTLCRADDPDAAIAPRVAVEDAGRTLRSLDADLEDASEVLVRYIPTPDALPATETADPATVGLPAIAHELLVLDLARWCVSKASGLDAQAAQLAMQATDAEGAELLGLYQRQVQTFAPATSDRFARPVRLPDTLAAPRA